MFARTLVHSIIYSILCTLMVLTLLNVGFAQVSTSTNYQLQSDSLNFGGGYSSSTSYIQESTFGEVGTGLSTSTSYSLRAGYQQLQEVFLSLAGAGDVAMSPSLPGLTGGESNGSTTVTVLTDNLAGYQLTLQAENSPAMQYGAFSINDYSEVSGPDFDFTTTPADAHFGYSVDGVDEASRFAADSSVGGTCGAGSVSVTLRCWEGLATTPQIIAQSSGSNQPAGATTTINFRVGIGGAAGVVAGEYTATTTITALPL